MFGALKYNQGTAVNMSVESADAMTMAQRNHVFDKPGAALVPKRLPRRVRRNASSKRHKKRRNDKHGGGRLAARGVLKPALMAAAHRRVRDGTAKLERDTDIANADKSALTRRKRDLDKRLEQQAKALLAAEKWFGVVRIKTAAELATRVAARPSLATKCELAKQQIQHLVDGCGLREQKPKRYSSKNDAAVGESGTQQNLDFLTAALRGIWDVIARDHIELPSEPAMPQVGWRAQRICARHGTRARAAWHHQGAGGMAGQRGDYVELTPN